MKLPESKYFHYKNFVISDKSVIKNLTIAYRTWGKLNLEKNKDLLKINNDPHEAVLGANVTITSSTKILDVTGPKTVEHKGIIPERSVVIPGSYKKNFSSGEFYVPCALIIGKRKESTNKKTSLNDALRTHNVSV